MCTSAHRLSTRTHSGPLFTASSFCFSPSERSPILPRICATTRRLHRFVFFTSAHSCSWHYSYVAMCCSFPASLFHPLLHPPLRRCFDVHAVAALARFPLRVSTALLIFPAQPSILLIRVWFWRASTALPRAQEHAPFPLAHFNISSAAAGCDQ